MEIEAFQPQPKLVTKATSVPHPRFRVIDAHNHLAEPFGGGWDKRPLSQLIARYIRNNEFKQHPACGCFIAC